MIANIRISSRSGRDRPRRLVERPARRRFLVRINGRSRQTDQMGRWDLVRREHVLAAVQEYEELGQARFLDKYRFGPARSYQLMVDGRSYDSKAILGAAHGYAAGSPLSSRDFSGGTGYTGAASVLQRLGFEVAKTADSAVGRRQAEASATTASEPERAPLPAGYGASDVVLIGCVKTKQSTAAPARDLYTSALFTKRRRYAEATGQPWYILSALHGLVDPDQVLEPYDMHLAKQTSAYRQQWAAQVIRDLTASVGTLADRTIEIHAGAAYVDPLDPLLAAAGAQSRAPLRGLNQGQHLAWYGENLPSPTSRPAVAVDADADADADADMAITALTGTDPAPAPAPASAFPWTRKDLHGPGLYAWWVDSAGGADLSLSTTSPLTLVYAGQAGATRWPSGSQSAATLFSRINGQHLGGRISSSTFRQTLAVLLRERLGLQMASPDVLTADSENRLSDWMADRLSATVWPTAQADHLNDIEQRVITRLDPPLNLSGATATTLRARVTAGRRALHLPSQD